MPEIQLNDQIFKVAQRRAADGGYSSVDEYIADIVVHDITEDADNFNDVFTPERLARLGEISAEIKAGGKTHTIAEVQEHFENKRKAWLANHVS
jgi:hypothetical protein